MSPTVVVMVPAGEIAAPDARALVAACTAALRSGQCVTDAREATTSVAVAVVSLGANGAVRVEVDVRATDALPARHPVRELTFHDADPVSERWKSVGFAIAGLSGAALTPAPEPEPEPEAPAPTPAPPAAARTNPAAKPVAATTASTTKPFDYDDREHPMRASAALEAGPGLTRGTWRLGGNVGFGYDLDDGFWGFDARAGYSSNPATVSGVDVSWLTLTAGASVAYTMFDVEGRLGVLLGARDVHAAQTDAASGQSESRSRWLPVGIVHASARWPSSTLLGVLSGIELRRATGGTAVESHGAYIGSSSALDFGLFLGVEVRP